MISRSRALVGAVVLVFAASLTGYFVGQLVTVQQHNWSAAARTAGPDWGRLDEVRRYLRTRFVDNVSDEKLLDGALRGMVGATGDPYSVYFTGKQYKDFLAHFDDTFVGIGVTLERTPDKYLTVIKPIKGSPSEKAGLQAGDRIVAVDGQDIGGKDLDEALLLVRGAEGTSVTLTVQRAALPPFQVSLKRTKLTTPVEEHQLLPGNVGYIQLYEFNTNSAGKVKAGIQELHNQGMTGLILDLRQNPGGLLNEALDLAEQLVPRGPILHVVDRSGNRKTYDSKSDGFGMPLVILVDKGSASAAEVVAGAVKDRRSGTLVGTRTYGKGSVQNFFPLGAGAGLKLTTQKYLTAGGVSINGIGIEPDVTVDMPEHDKQGHLIEFGSSQDTQLKRALEVINSKR